MSDRNIPSNLVLCRAAGWLAAPEGESRESTIALINDLVACVKGAPETKAIRACVSCLHNDAKLCEECAAPKTGCSGFDANGSDV